MVQDFAKIRPEPVLEKRAMDAPPAWTLLITGLVTGIAVGVFGCFLLYLSGHVPPLQGAQTLAETGVPVTAVQAPPLAATAQAVAAESEVAQTTENVTPAEAEAANLRLGFYDELRDYEVQVDATPVPLPAAVEVAVEAPAARQQAAPASPGRLLQIGAFQQVSSAERQLNMLVELGVSAVIRQQAMTGGRVLHLVQAGPYSTATELNDVRSLLQRNDINSFPLDPR